MYAASGCWALKINFQQPPIVLEPRPGLLPTGNLYGDDGPEASAAVRLQEVVEGEAELANSSPRP